MLKLGFSTRMTSALPSVLERIVAHKRRELAQAPARLDETTAQAELNLPLRRDFAAALRREGPAIIAELKKASPSKGLLASDYRPPVTAPAYERGGAAALSVLTDQHFFQGSLADLETARAATRIPVLRKDFTIDPYHVLEAAAHGADAVLLIVAILSDVELRQYRELAEQYRMTALVEVHDDTELQRAIDSGARVIGVNNRDLRTFEVRLDTALRLAERIPETALRVAESGIQSAGDIRTLRAAGYDAFLVGEHLITSADPAQAVQELLA
jgi:indole-3-glycerol phosphate synthase